jgi:hypothetical protein
MKCTGGLPLEKELIAEDMLSEEEEAVPSFSCISSSKSRASASALLLLVLPPWVFLQRPTRILLNGERRLRVGEGDESPPPPMLASSPPSDVLVLLRSGENGAELAYDAATDASSVSSTVVSSNALPCNADKKEAYKLPSSPLSLVFTSSLIVASDASVFTVVAEASVPTEVRLTSNGSSSPKFDTFFCKPVGLSIVPNVARSFVWYVGGRVASTTKITGRSTMPLVVLLRGTVAEEPASGASIAAEGVS